MTGEMHAISLGGQLLPLVGGSQPFRRPIVQFPPPVVVGRDPRGAQSHVVRSTLSLSVFAGGIGRYAARPAEEGVERYWSALGVDTRYAGFTTLGPLRTEVALPAPMASTIGGFFYLEYGSTSIKPALIKNVTCRAATTNLASDGTGGFAATTAGPALAVVASKPVRFRGNTFFAEGSANPYQYRVSDPGFALSNHSGGTPSGGFVAFAATGNLLFGIRTDGTDYSVWSCATPDSTTATWTQVCTLTLLELNEGSSIFLSGLTGDGYPALYLVTARRVIQIDPFSQQAVEVWTFPNPASVDTYGTRPVVVWDKTKFLYVTDGINLFEIGGSTIRNLSPFRDDGLPSAATGVGLGGTIDTLFTMQNWLGIVTSPQTIGGSSAPGSVMLYDGVGWAPIGQLSSASVRAADAIAINNAIYVATDNSPNNTVTQFYVPDTLIPTWARPYTQNASYAATGYMVTSWFDADLPAIDKVADSVELLVQNVSASNQITVSYQTDSSVNDNSWTALGTTGTTPTEGRHTLTFGTQGVTWKRTRFKIAFARSSSLYDTPILQNFALLYVVRPQILYSWDVQIDCRQEAFGLTPQQLRDFVLGMLQSKTMQPFVYGDTSHGSNGTKYVLVSGYGSNETVDKTEPVERIALTLVQVRSEVT